jgi:ferric citrate transport system substrate-binding protein
VNQSYKRLWAALATVVAASLCVVAAAAAPATAAPDTVAAAPKPDPTCGPTRTRERTVNHTFGSLVMRGTPQRVVALEFSFVDALLAVGVRPVGLADDRDPTRILPQYRAKLGQYTSVGLRATPNLETISSLNPDLIIADVDRHRGIFRQLERIAPTIALDSLQQAYLPNLHSAVVIGQAVNRCGAMIARLQRHRANMDKVARAIPDNEKRNVMFAVSARTIFNMHNSGAYTPSVLSRLGLQATVKKGNEKNAAVDQGLTLETLFTMNPDILIIANQAGGTVSDGWQSNPIWQQLKAVKNKQVYYVDGNLWSRWRGISAAEVIGQQTARLIYKKYVPLKIG